MNVAQFVSTVDRIPPSNLEAEMALLGSILVDKEMMATVSEIVAPSDFYASLHETIYLALYALYERGEPLDKVALAEELRNRGMLDKIGGMAYLNSLMDTVPTAASADYYARIVREKSSLRQLIHAGTRITQLGYDSEDDVPAAIDRAEQVVYDVGNRSEHNAFATVPSMLLPVFQALERRHEQKGDRTGVTSGFRDIDDYTAGWQPGNLIIVAARPAMGKTSLALNMAVAAAKDEKKPVAVFSLEMTKQELVERLLSSEARLDASKLRRGAIADRDWEKIGHAMGVLHELPIYLDDAGAITITEIRSRLRRLKSAVGLSCVFIDYLQLVRPAIARPPSEPQRRALRHLPHPQSNGQRPRVPDHRPGPAQPRRRNPRRQTPAAVRFERLSGRRIARNQCGYRRTRPDSRDRRTAVALRRMGCR